MTLACDFVRDRLSDLIDDALAVDDRRALAAHLATCADCAALAEDLRHIAAAARTLGPLEPPAHVREAVARTWTGGRASGRVPVAMLAMAAALSLAVGASLVAVRRSPEPGQRVAADPAAWPGVPGGPGMEPLAADRVLDAGSSLTAALPDLSQPDAAPSAISVNPEVVAMLRQTLAIVDAAIAQSQRALADHPDDPTARESLASALQQKASAVGDTVAAMNDLRTAAASGAAPPDGSR